MRYLEIKPKGALAKLVQRYWVFEQDCSNKEKNIERIFPDGYTDLFFHYGELFQRYDQCLKPIGENIRSGIAGPFEQHIFLSSEGKTKFIGARLYPGAAADLLKLPADLISNNFVELKDAIPSAATNPEDELFESENDHQRLAILQKFLFSCYIKASVNDPVADGLLGHILETRGNINIKAFASKHDLSVRTMQRRFKERIGLPPKRYAGLIRFRNIVKSIKLHRNISFTSLAHEYGYFDQAHFVNDFKKIAGLSPRSFSKESHPISEALNDLGAERNHCRLYTSLFQI